MISACANPDCRAPLDYRGQGQFFRFHRDAWAGETPIFGCAGNAAVSLPWNTRTELAC